MTKHKQHNSKNWWDSRRGDDPDPDLVSVFWENLDREEFARICTLHESEFEAAFGFDRVQVEGPAGEDFFLFRPGKGEGRSILAVAHLDTVIAHYQRQCGFLETAGGEVVYSGALDDRLGAYIILALLPKVGLDFDVLLTVGEESGRSTAQFFDGVREGGGMHEYNWMIEFDRGGTDVVCYEYETPDLVDLIEDTGARVEQGIFSDISYMEHIGVKGINWGVGYRDYHGVRGHAWLDDTAKMFAYFLAFHETNKGLAMPHTPDLRDHWLGYGRHDHGTYLTSECELLDLDCDGEVDEYDNTVVCVEHAVQLGLLG